MSLLKNIGTEDGDNVGACISKMITEIFHQRHEFLRAHDITLKFIKESGKSVRHKYNQLWKQRIKEHSS